jgi:two-component system response regulator MprA
MKAVRAPRVPRHAQPVRLRRELPSPCGTTGFQDRLRRGWHDGEVTDSKPRVLVVDDDRAVRDSLRRSLEFNGYEVVLAGDGAEGLVAVGAQHPDVVVIDVMMPRLDGIETTRALRTAGNDVPILVLTARDAVGDRVEGLDAGADDYLTKPFALVGKS